jgi:hypothetical protein
MEHMETLCLKRHGKEVKTKRKQGRVKNYAQIGLQVSGLNEVNQQ